MLKNFKYRSFPNKNKKEILVNILYQVRFVYNLDLEIKIIAYIIDKIFILIVKENTEVFSFCDEFDFISI